MQHVLEDLNSLYKEFIDAAADAIIVIDQAGIIRHFSHSAQQLFGYDSVEVLGLNVSTLMPDPHSKNHDDYLSNYLATGQAKIIGQGRDVYGVKKDKSLFPMHLSVGTTVIKDQRYFVGICHDLSVYRKTLAEKLQLESLQTALFDAAVDGIITIDQQGLITSFNSAAESLFGYQRQEVLNKNVSMLMPEPFARAHDSYLQRYISGQPAQIIGKGRDVPGKRKDGSIFPMHLSVGKAQTEGGALFIGLCHDLTEYQNALLDLAKAEQRYKSIVDCEGQLLCRLDQHLKITFVNQAFVDVFECKYTELIGLDFINLFRGSKHGTVDRLQRLFIGDSLTRIHFQTVMERKSGPFEMEWWFTKISPQESGLHEIQGFGVDVSLREQALREIEYLKFHDSLTGLLNMEGLIRAFEQTHTPSRKAVLYFDCNHFNLFNTRFGYEAGDQMLIEASQRFKDSFDIPTLRCRPGSDSFIALIECKDKADAIRYALQIIEQLEQPYLIGTENLRPSVKVGISIYPDDSSDLPTLLQMAESVLPQAFLSRPHICFFDRQYQQVMSRQLDIEQGLKSALQQGALQIFVQSKVSLKTRQVIAYEALLRWQDTFLGPISPAEFVPIAERMNLGQELDLYVLRHVFQLLNKQMKRNNDVVPIAVNITSSHFSAPSLVSAIEGLAKDYDVPLWLLQLEVTETVLLEMTEQVRDNIYCLQNLGVIIAIDDFGTGYSSLSYLRHLQLDQLKIDKSFIDSITDPSGMEIVRAVIWIARACGMHVIAEGVETEQQANILEQLGCDTGQGYLFAKPFLPY